MFKWRRRNEGFEWREYVRTTILVRRKERRQKVRDVRDAAVDQVKEAGRRSVNAGVSGASAAGRNVGSAGIAFASWVKRHSRSAATAAGRGLGAAARSIGGTTSSSFGAAASSLGNMGRSAGASIVPRLEPVLSFAREPHIRLPLILIAAISGLAAVHRLWTFGFDQLAVIAACFAAVAATVLAVSRLTETSRSETWAQKLERWGDRLVLLPGLDRLTPAQAGTMTFSLGVALIAAGCAWFTINHPPQIFSRRTATASTTASPDPSVIEGRATAESGDRLRIAATRVRLAGVESPEPDQTCMRAGSKWRCGAAAKDALARAIRGHRVTCDMSGSSEPDVKIGRCTVDGADLAATLVQSGHVFAETGIFSRYGGEENEARSAKAGLWSGDADRPADYRAKVWEEAKLHAPSGCPIKGRVASGARVYVLPWSPSYDSIRLSTTRGERWFCSEEEAQAAGWHPVTSSRGAS